MKRLMGMDVAGRVVACVRAGLHSVISLGCVAVSASVLSAAEDATSLDIGPVYMVVLDRTAMRDDLSAVPEAAVLFRGRMDDNTQLFLPPERQLSIVYAVPLRGWLYFSRLTTKGAGTRSYPEFPTNLGPIRGGDGVLRFHWLSPTPDTDGDGIANEIEWVVGTSRTLADTDGDGMDDRSEIASGSNPSDNRPTTTGLIAVVDTPGHAIDVAVQGGVAAVADSDTGVLLFDVSNVLRPVRIAQVPTPGPARAVAFGPGLLAVACSTSGLAIVDVLDPPAAAVLHRISFGAEVRCVATDGAVAFAGLANGTIAMVDMPSGLVLETRSVTTAAIQDLVVGREVLYLAVSGLLYAVSLEGGEFGAVTATTSSGGVGAGGRRLRLSLGTDRLYFVHTQGVNVFSLADPFTPSPVRSTMTAQAGWKHIVPNGTGLALAAVDANSTNDGAHDVSVYRLPADGTIEVMTTSPTPGLAEAVAIYHGLGFVADGASGLGVVNYLAFDTLAQAPTITLGASFALGNPGQAEEGKRVRLSADVADDVQVREVEFLIDGQRVGSDGGYPFEWRFVTPVLSASKTSFTVQARAIDTGGNAAATPVYTINLVPDGTPPRVKRVAPTDKGLVGTLDTVLVTFSEPIDLATITDTSIVLSHSGPDRIFDTADDQTVVPAARSWRENNNTVALLADGTLPAGQYRLRVTAGVTDLAGNPLTPAAVSYFTVFGLADRDRDGVPDLLEASLGLDPDKPDTDGDGISDGLEDYDNDSLSNAAEVLLATDPRMGDSDGNGIADADEDRDGDGLSNRAEILRGTSPVMADSDGDGWNDEAEVAGRGDPLVRAIGPQFLAFGRPPVATVVYAFGASGGGIVLGPVLADPPVGVVVQSISASSGEIVFGPIVADPPVGVVVQSISASSGDIVLGPVVADPPVGVVVQSISASSGDIVLGPVMADPPVSVTIPSN